MSGSKINSNEAALYDRQIRLWGVHAQNQLKNSRILIVGLNALGAELCKNIVLAGLNVSLMDSVIVSERDLGKSFVLWLALSVSSRMPKSQCVRFVVRSPVFPTRRRC